MKVLDDLVCRHSQHELPPSIDKHCAPFVVDSAAIVDALKSFPRKAAPEAQNFVLNIFLTQFLAQWFLLLQLVWVILLG